MKKVVSISMSIIMLIAVLHIAVARHYCCGQLAASTISFTGKTASCGMEDDHDPLPIQGTSISRHCCENVLYFFGTNGNYFPTFYSSPESFQNQSQVLIFADQVQQDIIVPVLTFADNTSPPGEYLSSDVSLTDICTFRI
jgi:hypothetical protein